MKNTLFILLLFLFNPYAHSQKFVKKEIDFCCIRVDSIDFVMYYVANNKIFDNENLEIFIKSNNSIGVEKTCNEIEIKNINNSVKNLDNKNLAILFKGNNVKIPEIEDIKTCYPTQIWYRKRKNIKSVRIILTNVSFSKVGNYDYHIHLIFDKNDSLISSKIKKR